MDTTFLEKSLKMALKLKLETLDNYKTCLQGTMENFLIELLGEDENTAKKIIDSPITPIDKIKNLEQSLEKACKVIQDIIICISGFNKLTEYTETEETDEIEPVNENRFAAIEEVAPTFCNKLNFSDPEIQDKTKILQKTQPSNLHPSSDLDNPIKMEQLEINNDNLDENMWVKYKTLPDKVNVGCMPAGMERQYSNQHKRKKNFSQEKRKQSLMIEQPSVRPKFVTSKIINMDDWDPMNEEFSSTRNNYQLDCDDATTAVEGYNSSNYDVCEYFLKGNCWYGDSCKKYHPKFKDDKIVYEVPTLIESDIPDMDLKFNSFYAGCVFALKTENLVYIHLLCEEEYVNAEDCKQVLPSFSSFSLQLSLLMEDMEKFYKNRRKSCNRSAISEGEIYCVYVEKCCSYLRGLICDVQDDAIEVFLVDIGSIEYVDYKNVFDLKMTFMHLPKQVQLCTTSNPVSKAEEGRKCAFRIANKFESADTLVEVSLYF